MMIRIGIAFLLAVSLGIAPAQAAEPDPAVFQKIEQFNADVFTAYQRGDYQKGIELARKAAAYAERQLATESPLLAITINNLGALYDAQGDRARAEPLYQRALTIREKALGPNHPDVARSLNNLAELYRTKGDYTRAEPLYRRSLAIRENVLGPDHADVAKSLNNLATLYLDTGDYTRAEPLYQRALANWEKKLGPAHPEISAAINNLAGLYHRKGDYARAESLYQRALAIQESALGPDHPNVAINLNNLAALYENNGDYARAEPLYLRSLAIREQSLGPAHSDVAHSLSNLASLQFRKGDFTRAELLYQRSRAILEKGLGPNHPDVAAAINNLAELYKAKGDYKRAEPLFQRTLTIWEKSFGPDHPNVATALSNLGGLYRVEGDSTRAESLYQRALSIKEKSLGPDHPHVANVLMNLAAIYQGKADYERAESLFLRALAIQEKSVGPDHPDVAISLNNLGLLYQRKGDYTRAESLFQRSLTVTEAALGPEHPDTGVTLSNLALLRWAQGDIRKAIALHTRAGNIEERHLSLILAAGSEAQKRAFAETLATPARLRLSLHLDGTPENPEAARLAFTTLLQRKGRVLDALTEGLGTLRTRLTPEDRELLDQLTTARSQLAHRVNQSSGMPRLEQHRKQIDEIAADADRLEGAISTRSAEFRVQSQPITLKRVQQALPAERALVELAVYRPFDPKAVKWQNQWGPPRYAAYVLFPEGEPKWAALGEAAQIDKAVEALRASLRTPASRSRSRGGRGQVLDAASKPAGIEDPARTLDELVMHPIRILLGNTRTVLFSPDGALNQIPLGALVDENGQALIENYHVTYLTSGRDLLRLQLAHDAEGPALVLADPDFGSAGTKSRPGVAPDRGRRSANMTRGSLHFAPLPGTAQEAQAIGPLLGTQPLTRAHATETALKQVHQPSVLHIATHGFFLPDRPQEPLPPSYQGWDDSLPAPAPPTENPLLRSGLALAGANRLQSGTEDGLLTALEASGLDLWGTQLVVLSACETGIGEVQTGEGVYGLRRALVNAGAETQVMSLWKVDDAATRDLMVDYYRRLKAGEGRSEALRQAQLSMLHSKDHRHPHYWASFIVSGDWRELRVNSGSSARQ